MSHLCSVANGSFDVEEGETILLYIVEHIPYESKSSFHLSIVKDRCCVPFKSEVWFSVFDTPNICRLCKEETVKYPNNSRSFKKQGNKHFNAKKFVQT